MRKLVIDHIAALVTAVQRPHPIRVAVDGVDAAGKTTLADELVEPVRGYGRSVIRASVDGFHNPRAARYRRGPDSPEGYYLDSFDYPALTSVLLKPLGPRGNRQYQAAIFEYRTNSPVHSPVRRAPIDAILLFDGIFLLRPALYDYWDFRIFVDVRFETAVARAVQRDRGLSGSPEDVRERYALRYIPAQRMYLKRCRPGKRADLIVGNDDLASPTLRNEGGILENWGVDDHWSSTPQFSDFPPSTA